MKPPSKHGSPNDFRTPPEALLPLYPYLSKDWIIWECACGGMKLVHALLDRDYCVIGSDIIYVEKHDFLTWEPPRWDCIITNPPYSIKQQFLERAYLLGKPFAFLLPLTTFESEKRQRLFRDNGLEVIFMPKRINFETPSGNGSGVWFATAWFTWKLNIGKEMTFWQ